LVSIGLVLSEEKIFEKAYDVRRRRTPSDGNSSPDPCNDKILCKENCFNFVLKRKSSSLSPNANNYIEIAVQGI
jgi:hypothetical protein